MEKKTFQNGKRTQIRMQKISKYSVIKLVHLNENETIKCLKQKLFSTELMSQALYDIYFPYTTLPSFNIQYYKAVSKTIISPLRLEEIEAAKDLNNTTARVTQLPFEPRPT